MFSDVGMRKPYRITFSFILTGGISTEVKCLPVLLLDLEARVIIFSKTSPASRKFPRLFIKFHEVGGHFL